MRGAKSQRPDGLVLVRELALKGSMPLNDFVAHLVSTQGMSAPYVTELVAETIQAGLIWVGCDRPRRGRPDYVALTGDGHRLVRSVKLAESQSLPDSAVQSTIAELEVRRRPA